MSPKLAAPMGTRCGDLFDVEDRVIDVKAARKLSGGVGKTKELADSRQCQSDAKHTLHVTDDLQLAVCERHYRQLTPVAAAQTDGGAVLMTDGGARHAPPEEEAAPPGDDDRPSGEGEVVSRQSGPETAKTDSSPSGVKDAEDMQVHRVSIHEWRVGHLHQGDENTGYRVNMRDLTCECKDNRNQGRRDEDEYICKHISKVFLVAPTDMAVGDALRFDLLETAREIRDATASIQRKATGLQADQAAATADTDESDSQDGSTDAGGSDDGEVSITEKDATSAANGMMDDLTEWFESAQQFNQDVDPAIVSLDWVAVNGTEGVRVDRSPWNGDGYWDGDKDGDARWLDKDGYEDARDAIGELLSNQDATEWFGEPDYLWFIPADDISEVTG